MNSQNLKLVIRPDYSPMSAILLTTPKIDLPSDAEMTGSSNLQRTRKTLNEALEVCEELNSRKPIVEVLTGFSNIQAVGIGHLLHHGIRKKYFNIGSACEILEKVYTVEAANEMDGPITRHRLLTRLRQLDLIEPGVSARSLKPVGTTPCVKSLSVLIAERAKLSFEDITSPSRRKEIVKARFHAIWVMRHVCGHSLSMIGQCMGNRDHTTILNSINKVALLMQADMGIRREVETLCEQADAIGIMQNRNMLLRSVSNH